MCVMGSVWGYRGPLVDGISEALRCRATIGAVVLDTPILLRTTGVVTGSQNESTERLAFVSGGEILMRI